MGRPRRTHCKRGHPLAGDNLYVYATGQRTCKACRSASRAKYYRRTYHPVPPSKRKKMGRKKTRRCIRGHKWTPENTRLDVRGNRVCMKCRLITERARNGSVDRETYDTNRDRKYAGVCAVRHPYVKRDDALVNDGSVVACNECRRLYRTVKQQIKTRILGGESADDLVVSAADHHFDLTEYARNLHRAHTKMSDVERAACKVTYIRSILRTKRVRPGHVAVWPWPLDEKNTSTRRRGSKRRNTPRSKCATKK